MIDLPTERDRMDMINKIMMKKKLNDIITDKYKKKKLMKIIYFFFFLGGSFGMKKISNDMKW